MNFKEYIENDIEEKKVLLNLLPRNTEVRLKKYKETISEIIDKYQTSLDATKAFINYKYEKLFPVDDDKSVQKEELSKKISSYRKLLVLTNPNSSFFERLGFDICFYNLMHYYDRSIFENNKVIAKFVNKFEESGVILTANDFKINVYTYIYMDYFLKAYKDVNALADEVYDKIFWKCPKVFENIIMIFKMLIKKYEAKLKRNVKSREIKCLRDKGFHSREDLVKALLSAKLELEKITDKNEYQIIKDFMSGDADLSMYLNNEESLKNDLEFFVINPIDLSNNFEFTKTVNSIFNLEDNLIEYKQYSTNKILFDEVRTRYEKKVSTIDKKTLMQNIKLQEQTINKLIGQIKKLMVVKHGYDLDHLELLLSDKEQDRVFEQQKLFNELYKEYVKSNDLYLDCILKNMITANSLVSGIIDIIISYPYYGRKMVKKVFELENEDEVTEKMDELFWMYYNPKKKIINMKQIFSQENFERELRNGYRFENLNVHEDSFEEESFELILFNCKKLHIRLKMKKFLRSVDEISFLVDVKKLKDLEKI